MIALLLAAVALMNWDVRTDVPIDMDAPEKLEVAFPQLAPGTLIGTLELVAPWTDARGTEIPAGKYTVRYALRPNDGNHMGVSDYRDFLVLIPASDDPGAAAKPEYEELMTLGKKTTAGRHPAVMGLAPAPEAEMKVHVGELVLGVLLKHEGDH
jgi:hypothetical protein